MKNKLFKAPYDERNNADYLEITSKIEAALKKLESDSQISATEGNLAKLAGCSRGTLRNRVEPIVRLKLIKKNRKQKIKKAVKNQGNEFQNEEKITKQLHNSRCEVAVWVNKYKEIESELKKVRRAFDLLKGENHSLKNQNKVYLTKIVELEEAYSPQSSANIIPINKLTKNKHK